MGIDESGAKPFLTPLKRISNPKGDIFHIMKRSDSGFVGFGEAYFTTVYDGAVKGWKRHRRMTLNLTVPFGAVKFVIYDEKSSAFHLFELSAENYARLTIPPGLWVAFAGIGTGMNLILNIADIEHDPDESDTMELDRIGYVW